MNAPSLNPDWAKLPIFNRSEWKSVRFGDVVENVNETERYPNAAGIERFIGLEHLEPGSLHIRAWGNVADGTTVTRRCSPGQVLFGKRRGYRRKVALSEFDAVVSGDIYVLRPKNDRLLPELLPFICSSERFFQFAVETSSGSMSPRTNWGHLAKFEFALPPLDQQRRIAEILWAVDEVLIAHEDSERSCREAINARLAHTLRPTGNGRKNYFPTKPLSEIACIRTGIAKGKTYPTGLPTIKLPYLRVANVQDGYLDLSEMKTIDIPKTNKERYLLHDGDVVICEGGDFDKVGRGTIWRNQIPECLHQNHVFCLRADRSALMPEFLALQLSSPYAKRYFLGCAKKTSNLACINSTQVKAFLFQLPSLREQQRFVGAADKLESARAELLSNHTAVMNMLKALIRALS